MAAFERAQLGEEYSRVRGESIEASRLYSDGFLFFSDVDDLKEWILNNNHNPAHRCSVRCLELNIRPHNFELNVGPKYLETIGDESIGILPELTHLFITGGTNLQGLPSSFISRLPNLQRLQLLDCLQLRELPLNLGDLQSLTFLSLDECSRIEYLPHSIVDLPNLTTLHLKHCDSLTHLPAIPSLVALMLDQCGSIRSLPLCNNLQWLHLHYCKSLSLIDFPADLNVLRYLIMVWCGEIEFLPDGICANLHLLTCSLEILLANLTCLQNLTHLTLDACNYNKCERLVLCIDFGELLQLLLLNIQQTQIHWLPWNITNLSNLRLLLLPSHFRLETLPQHLNDSLVISVQSNHVRKTWKHLKTEITTFSMPITWSELREEALFPSTPIFLPYTWYPSGPATRIQNSNLLVKVLDLNFDHWKFDEDEIDWIGELPHLTHLYIAHASLSLLHLTSFKRITHLFLSSCSFYDNFLPWSHSVRNISNLQSLKLVECKNFPAHMDFLPVSLTHFSVQSDHHNQPLPDSYMAYMTKLSHLTTLELSGFTDLELSPLNLNNNLAKLKLTHCSNTNSLPTTLQHLEILHSQEWCQFESCNDAHVCLDQMINLETLSITCYNIEVLPSLGRPKSLQQLQLKDCFNLNKLPPDLDELVELCTLDVSGTRIKSLPGGVTELPKLQRLIVPKYFMFESLPESFQHKVKEDVTDDMYYEHAGYYDARYNSSEDNRTTSGSVDTSNQVVPQESSHNIIPEQPSAYLLPDATQVQEGPHLSSRKDPVNNVVFSSQDLEMQNLPTGNEELAVPFAPNNISDFSVTEHHSANEIRQVNAAFGELEVGGDQVVSQEPSHNNIISEQASLSRPLNPLPDATQVHEADPPQGENNQQGIQNGGMDNASLVNEHRNPPCDSINSGRGRSDKNSQGGEVKLKKTQKKIISKESILQCRSNNLTIDEAAHSLGVGRATLVRKNREYNISWLENRKRKEPEDENNKEQNTELHYEGNSSQINSMNPSNSARRDHGTGHNQLIAGSGSCSIIDVKAAYGGRTVRIDDFSLSSTIEHLKEEVGNKHGIEAAKIEIEYQDITKERILVTEVSDLVHAEYYSESSGKRVIKLLINLKT